MGDHDLERGIIRLAQRKIDQGWLEADVREEVLTPLLHLLGYEKGTSYDINREEHLLRHPYLMVGSEKLRLDYAVLVRRIRFWVLEAKRPSIALGPEAVHQAYSYAIHPEVQARFFAVGNGHVFRLYDVREVDERYLPTLQFELRQLPENFERLRQLIGADCVRDELARRALDDLDRVLGTEVRSERVDNMERTLKSLVARARPVVKENARRLRMRRSQADDEGLVEMFSSDDPVAIARVAFEFFDTPHQFDLVYGVFKRKLDDLPAEQRLAAVRKVAALLDSDLASTHRVHALQALLRLLPDLAEPLKAEVACKIQRDAKRILNRFPGEARLGLLWRLEGLVSRVPYKASLVQDEATEKLRAIVERKLATLPEEELVHHQPTLWGERHAWSARMASELVGRFRGQSEELLEAAVQELEAFEQGIEQAYQVAIQRGFDGEPTPPYFVHFDDPLDCYCSRLFAVLLAEFHTSAGMADDEFLEATEGLLRRVQEDEYALNHADTFWVRVVHERGGMSRPGDPETGEPLTDDALKTLMVHPTIHRGGWSAVKSGVSIRGQIGESRWAEFQANLDLERRQVVVGAGKMCR